MVRSYWYDLPHTGLVDLEGEHALAEAGVRDASVFVVEHKGVVQVLIDVPVSALVSTKMQEALRAAHPSVSFDFVQP